MTKILHDYISSTVCKALCSRNFQNVKLRLDLLNFDQFTATQILREIKFGEFKRSKMVNFDNYRGSEFWFWEIWATFKSKIYQNSKFSLWFCQKWPFWTVWIHQNLILRKIEVAVKWSNFNKSCLNFTFWKFL